MTYWGAGANTPDTLAGLLSSDTGRCGAWSSFLTEVLNDQGPSANILTISPVMNVVGPMLGPAPVFQGGYILGVVGLIKPNLPGQGNPNPKNDFVGWAQSFNGAPNIPVPGIHVVVQVAGINTIFDPSYGVRYDAGSIAAAEQAWEDGALLGWQYRVYQPGNTGSGPISNHQAGRRETVFQ